MVTVKTTLILGAGASAGYGFPVGEKLIEDIISLSSAEIESLKGDDEERRLSRSLADHYNLLRAFHKKLDIASPPSIDWFLGQYPEFREVGKNFITKIILDYEVTSQDSVLRTKDWYLHLLNALRTDNPADLLKNNLKIVTFNYDRSLSHYLYTKLDASYANSRSSIEQLFQGSLDIAHIYGRIGELPWGPSGSLKLEYGKSDVPPDEFKTHASNLRIIGEQNGSEGGLKMAKYNISWAERIIFLGFGFLPENLDYIQFGKLSTGKQVFATGFKLSVPETNKIGSQLGRTPMIFNSKPDANNIVFGHESHDCAQFLKKVILLDGP